MSNIAILPTNYPNSINSRKSDSAAVQSGSTSSNQGSIKPDLYNVVSNSRASIAPRFKPLRNSKASMALNINDDFNELDHVNLQQQLISGTGLFKSLEPEALTTTYKSNYAAAQAGKGGDQIYNDIDNQVYQLTNNYEQDPTLSNFQALTFAAAAISLFAGGLNLLLKQAKGMQETTINLSDLLKANSEYNGDLANAMNAFAAALQQKTINDVIASLNDAMNQLNSAVKTYQEENKHQGTFGAILGGLSILVGGILCLTGVGAGLGAVLIAGGAANLLVTASKYAAMDSQISNLQSQVEALQAQLTTISQDGLTGELQALSSELNQDVKDFNEKVQTIQKVFSGIELGINIALTVASCGGCAGLSGSMEGVSIRMQVLKVTAVAVFVVIPTVGSLIGGALTFSGEMTGNQSLTDAGNGFSTYSNIGGIVGHFIPADTLLGQIVQEIVSMGLNMAAPMGVAHWVVPEEVNIPSEMSEPISSLRVETQDLAILEKKLASAPESDKPELIEQIDAKKVDIEKLSAEITELMIAQQELLQDLKTQEEAAATGKDKDDLTKSIKVKQAQLTEAQNRFQSITGNRLVIDNDSVSEMQSSTMKFMKSLQALLAKIDKITGNGQSKVISNLYKGQTIIAYLNFAAQKISELAQDYSTVVDIINTAISSSIQLTDARIKGDTSAYGASVKNAQSLMGTNNTNIQEINTAINTIASQGQQQIADIEKALDLMIEALNQTN